jgi:hypothetical protein
VDGGVERAINSRTVLELGVVKDRVVVNPPAGTVHSTVDFVLDSVFEHAEGEVDSEMILDLMRSRSVELNVSYILEYFQKIE